MVEPKKFEGEMDEIENLVRILRGQCQQVHLSATPAVLSGAQTNAASTIATLRGKLKDLDHQLKMHEIDKKSR